MENCLNKLMNEQTIAQVDIENDKIDKELNSKLDQIGNEIKEFINSRVKFLASYLNNKNQKDNKIRDSIPINLISTESIK